jgi:hypothetical protein
MGVEGSSRDGTRRSLIARVIFEENGQRMSNQLSVHEFEEVSSNHAFSTVHEHHLIYISRVLGPCPILVKAREGWRAILELVDMIKRLLGSPLKRQLKFKRCSCCPNTSYTSRSNSSTQ